MERRGFMGMLGAAWAAMCAKLFASRNARIEDAEPEVAGSSNPSGQLPTECSSLEAMAIVQFSRWCIQKGLSFDVGRIANQAWALNVYASPRELPVFVEMSPDLITAIESVKFTEEREGVPVVREDSQRLVIAARAFNRICDLRSLHWRVEKIDFEYRLKVWGPDVLGSFRNGRLESAIHAATHSVCGWQFGVGERPVREPVASERNHLSQLVGTSDQIMAMLAGTV